MHALVCKENKMNKKIISRLNVSKVDSILLLFLFIVPSFGFAVPSNWTDNALQAGVTRDGFTWISSMITDETLQDISRRPLPDVDENMGGGVQGELTGLSYDIDFDHLEINPSDNTIGVHLHMNSIFVRADRLKFVKKAGVTLRTTCEDVEIRAGGSSSIDLYLNLEPRVENGRIRLVERDIQFDIDDDNFKVDGPRHCSGSLGIGSLIGTSVHYVLGHSKNKMLEAVKDRVRSTIPKMEDSVNSMVATSFPISLGGSNSVTERQLLVRGRPNSIAINGQGLNANLDISVEPSALNLFAEDQEHKGFFDFRGPDAILASVALKTALINQLLQYAVPQRSNPIIIDTHSSPASQIFSRSSISSILPDLNQLTLDNEAIGASLSFDSPPVISTRTALDGSIELLLQCPDLHILLSIEKDGKVLPYFDLKIDAGFGIRIAKDPSSNALALTVQAPEHVIVDGAWAPGYVPQLNIFERDVAQVLFSSAIEYLFVAQPVFRMQAPHIEVGRGHFLEVAYPFATSELIGVALSGQ
jgi:hypothetical protein